MATHEDLLQIQSEGGTIAGTLISPQTRLPGVLFVHGWGGSQQQYLARARKVAGLGCVCLTFDLTGHAGTQAQYETVSRMRNLADVVAAYDVLVRQPEVDRNAIAVVGSSYGGYLAALLSTLRQVRWMAFRAPALYMDSGWELPKRQLHREQDLVAYRRSVVPPESNRALRACAVFAGDVLVIESEHDQVVPHAAVMSYVDACVHASSMTYRVIKGADHGLTEEESQRAYSSLLVNWLREMITVARAGPVSAERAEPPAERPAPQAASDELGMPQAESASAPAAVSGAQ
ncbi:alpha/beta fold hydrolase [Cupriavidus necator]|uniref:Alpha/beta fold hydrolase n=1 Tax=Cupriavidus necator TaxID=106590 RepID=A0A367PDI9_CUPNE|nr:alpha/beta fold hydrolase [Cupriavidus necator]QQX87171.1 alpha/beta fold hydrolase [Cupriavidus necator]RCJ05948.1 alpha/beta fold hydrolase [Cupriavidus necator]